MKTENATFEITKSHTLCIAHRLRDHKGKCKNLHGHNYKVEYVFRRKNKHVLGTNGMVIDFGTIKTILISKIEDRYDHSTFLQGSDLCQIAEGMKVIRLYVPPTSEYIAGMLLQEANTFLWNHTKGAVFVSRVNVYESENNMASAILED